MTLKSKVCRCRGWFSATRFLGNVILFCIAVALAGDCLAATLLTEGFEAAFVGGAPSGWTKSFKTGINDWVRNIGDSSDSDAAHGGTYNAMLYDTSSTSDETYLITPAINFGTNTANATLVFWHKQAVWDTDQDTLAVYYKTNSGEAWTLLATYSTNVTAWTQRTISLPNPGSTYYIGFLGNAKYGYGVCIDDVLVTGGPVTYSTISGTITSGGSGLAGVTVTPSPTGSAATTDASGNYSIANLEAGSTYTVTPAKPGYTFLPASIPSITVGPDATGKNFSASRPSGWTIYVWTNSPSPTPPYTNWTTAARTIQDAVDDAQVGDTVLVTNGIYNTGGIAVYGTMTNRVAINKAITVRSVNGPETAWIVGQGAGGSTTNGNGAIRCVYVGANALLSGFTLTNGHTRISGGYDKEQNGGGVWCEDGGTVTNCTLSGNSASINGGGSYAGTLNNCTLSGNSAYSGGGSYAGTLNNCTLSGNSARAGGGSRYGTLNNCTLSGNSASGAGGGGGGSSVGTLNNCTLTGNSATGTSGSGGGSDGGTLNNCTLTGNSATGTSGRGGGSYYGTLNNCTLSGNSASGSGGNGGGSASSTLNNCTLSGNSANYFGGGSYSDTLNNCTLFGNSASSYGGGSYGGTLNNCTLTGNAASYGGGADSGTLNNCTLSGNSASSGGGGSSGGTLNNCTLSGNSASSVGGGSNGGTLNNCIVYYNTAASYANYSSSTFSYSCTTPLPPGTGNIADAPALASATHLSALSPCIGKGSASYASGVDIDGEPWQNPPCMGADQYTPGAVTGALTVAISASYTNVAAGFAVDFAAQIQGRISLSVWNFGDGMVVSNQAFISLAWSVPGDYTVRLTGYNQSNPSGINAILLVRVAAQNVYYVNASNAAPVSPYTNWSTAAQTIPAAIDAGTQVGRLVLVTNGTYNTDGRAVIGTMTNRVVLMGGVTLRSMRGPGATWIVGRGAGGSTANGDGAIRCVYVGSKAFLSGFTLTNGHTLSAAE